jgi:hypothetical protein
VNPQLGQRFRLKRPVDRFPDFLAPSGLTGTITVTEGLIAGKMDQHIPGVDHWENEIWWDTKAEFFADAEPILS